MMNNAPLNGTGERHHYAENQRVVRANGYKHAPVGPVTSRQDSGYVSEHNSHTQDISSQNAASPSKPSVLSIDTSVQKENSQLESTFAAPESSDEELSPTSMEVLGLDILSKLDPKASKTSRDKRYRRPQPVVDAAYG